MLPSLPFSNSPDAAPLPPPSTTLPYTQHPLMSLGYDRTPYPDPKPNPNPDLNVPLSAWAELVWRYLLEVTNTVNPSSIPGSTLKKLF